MPPVRPKESDDDYKPHGKSVSSYSYANRPRRQPKRFVVSSEQLSDVLPFPAGDPTEPVHQALIAFCGKPVASPMLGTIDNLVVWLYFSTKHQNYRPWSLRTSKLPSKYDFQPILTKRLSKPLFELTRSLQKIPYAEWRLEADRSVGSVAAEATDVDFIRVLKSDDFAL
jgi:hypothetical protein